MPTRRTRGMARLTLRDLNLHEKLALRASWWTPGVEGRLADTVRFRTWPEYFDVYTAVRDELVAERHARPLFAELAYAHFQAGRDPGDARAEYDAAQEAHRGRLQRALTDR